MSQPRKSGNAGFQGLIARDRPLRIHRASAEYTENLRLHFLPVSFRSWGTARNGASSHH